MLAGASAGGFLSPRARLTLRHKLDRYLAD